MNRLVAPVLLLAVFAAGMLVTWLAGLDSFLHLMLFMLSLLGAALSALVLWQRLGQSRDGDSAPGE